MKKSKGQTIDLLYTTKKETNKKPSDKRKSVGAHDCARNTKNKKTNSNKKKTKNNDNDIINLDNEIIIGLTPKKEETKNKKNTKTKKVKNKKAKYKKNVGASFVSNSQAKEQKNKKINSQKKTINKKQNSKNKRKGTIVKWIVLLTLLVTAVVLFLMSSVFNIKEIVVVNNSKVASQEIINLSTLKADVNMFKITNGTIREGIKTNPYIEEVNVKKNINGTITLDIKERVPTFMLNFEEQYVYINNQGYMLEMSKEPLELPTITGISTPNEEIKVGGRLNTQDLNKLDDVIKIIEVSKNSSLVNIITDIDISNLLDYKLTVESKQKTVRIGDMTNINIKLQMAGEVFAAEEGKAGEVYFQDNGKKAVFKEEVSR